MRTRSPSFLPSFIPLAPTFLSIYLQVRVGAWLFMACTYVLNFLALTFGSYLQVLVGAWLDRRLRLHVRLHHDDAAALH